ncbi:MAG: NAD(P)-dependent oxidoreductase [Bacteroidia bacterium]|nr:NAD(P)-dependent oxidoreductase [Bacteroidia bacterium]
MKILLTGATGFIGSNIAKGLLENGYDVHATHRTSSSFEKCLQFKDKINWINTETCDWKEQIKSIKPDQLIHAAWGGIEAGNRNNWETQIYNFWLAKEFFDLAKKCGVKKIIAFGSQAEYGTYGLPVNEMTVPMPNDAYGATKTLTANYMRNLFENSATEWFWIRIFSVFGEGENPGWLIPSVISKLLKNESIRLTTCEQQYNYLYIEDFVNRLLSIVICKENKSGIYNLCNSESFVLKDLLIRIAELMNVSQDLLKFGEIPQRPGQNMFISGDNTKFINSFNVKANNPDGLNNGLRRTIGYYKKTI